MTREAPARDAPGVLDHLHRKLDHLLGDSTLPQPRADGFRSGIASAKLFVLDERAQHSGFPFPPTHEKK
ncbi:hypothetical protein AB4Z09_13200 [Rhodococcus sp. TAF43]|uniref:hypothetical protein n=1 Tax=unclassified Rhodococcus (in: high G+C Gram-positive bacteria) TaxID=192944 RepID=UPI000E0B922A|nr:MULTISPECIES: hypothetical protein [unclassified Rhodococcus (in: high G+C Gram-positive bacteria)]QKT10291.1 hypothetical protein HUN07_05815 [Rhodococcus sp. W8901]RDI20474.1 hypothetical protein DEU38_11623 [Rhodococcus sp. AG1013]